MSLFRPLLRPRRVALAAAVTTTLLAAPVVLPAEDAAAAAPPVQTVAGTTSLTAIDCEGADCVAVGNSADGGVVLAATDGVPGSPALVPGDVDGLQMSGVACGSPGHCLGIGTSAEPAGYVVPIDDAVPGTPVPAAGVQAFSGLACPTASQCIATGQSDSEVAVAVRISVTAGVTTAVPGPAQIPAGSPDPGLGDATLGAVGCPTSTTCYAVTSGAQQDAGALVPIVDGVVGTAVPDVGGDNAIACPTATLCYAVGSGLRRIVDGVPSAAVAAAPYALNAIACSSTTSCAAQGPAGIGVPIVDGAFGRSQTVTGVVLTRSTSCPSATACYAVGDGTDTGVFLTLAPPSAGPVADQQVEPGQDATFRVTTAGSPTPDVQWQLSTDGGHTFTDVGGATSGSYRVFDARPGESGHRYRAVVTNAAGVDRSAPAVLAVGAAPAITSEPSTALTIGAGARFAVTASGRPAPALAAAGALPGGVRFVPGPAGSARLSGTPGAGSAGTYPIAITATNPVGTATQRFTLTVRKAPSTTTLAGTGGEITAGDTVRLVATVAAPHGPGTPSGSVRFYDGGTPLGTVPLAGARTATFSTSALSAGTHPITVRYLGSATYAGSDAGRPVTVVVSAGPTGPAAPPSSTPPGRPPTSAAAGSQGGLAATGSWVSGLLGGAGLLVVVGGLALAVGTLRRRVARSR